MQAGGREVFTGWKKESLVCDGKVAKRRHRSKLASVPILGKIFKCG